MLSSPFRLTLPFRRVEVRKAVRHWPRVRDKVGFLRRLLNEFAGGRMSLEGDLSKCDFPENVVVGREALGDLQRNTVAPRQDFVVLRLEPDTAEPILKQILAAGLKRAILHSQIEHAGNLQMGAYDNFHPDCIVTGHDVSAALLTELQEAGILRGFRAADVEHQESYTQSEDFRTL